VTVDFSAVYSPVPIASSQRRAISARSRRPFLVCLSQTCEARLEISNVGSRLRDRFLGLRELVAQPIDFLCAYVELRLRAAQRNLEALPLDALPGPLLFSLPSLMLESFTVLA
jgi:hypothetical protein